MTKIYYFCNPGDTEIGGIEAFLIKINSGVQWIGDHRRRASHGYARNYTPKFSRERM
ncbi:hypothetical protein PCURB6_40970 [Paenibacillus curdlanolyticus]|nr:hypothetical protein PCURB6_40970 [Paenibacillus curdlanolyticus]